MTTWIRTNWSRLSGAILLATVLGVGGGAVYHHFADDCCQPGASCCKPGAACCKGHSQVAAR